MASDPTAIVLDLEEELRCLTSTPSQFSIFTVPQVLRNVNEKAYAPRLLSIGPYHHGKDQLLDFEKYKMSYLQRLLERRLDIPLSCYFAVMRELEETAKNCYGGSISLNQDEFVKMMILDGFFIVEVFRKFRLEMEGRRHNDPALGQGNDPIFELSWMLPSIAQDMILLENQLPFFVIWKLFSMTELPNSASDKSFLVTILRFFNGILPGKGCRRDDVYRIQEAGIEFRKVEVDKDDDSLFDIKFENGVMKMPSLEISDATETIFRNLIAYEQCSQDINLKHVIDYVKFLNCLIKTSKDAELLRRCGIINNLLGDDEVIVTLLNKLCEGVVLGERFYYQEVVNKVVLHCSRRRNKWMAKLRHNYFNNPWAIISFLAAVLLLLLTFVQTLFSVLSYYQ
ncbi:hypothetical protein CICLE_v10005120mg [Citrus x clementina]|uniref:Uncharacterized protein n=1 Tax=Citrus clementina TaxID=85681 RepID=V4S0P5_CITCL|nr:hypothetical protein CICLE_v10005120mg [Citrus x clementina]